MSAPRWTPSPAAPAWPSRWRSYCLLFLVALVPRLYLLRVFDVELSNDGFAAVRTLTIVQTQGVRALSRDLIDRFLLHPLHMILLGALRVATPAGFDFILAARLLSTVFGCLAVLVIFTLVRSVWAEDAAWAASLLLAFAPSFLWESVAILSSTLFLTLYLGVLLALVRERYRQASLLAFLSAITRYEGVVLVVLVFLALAARDAQARRIRPADWLMHIALSLAVPLTILATGWLATGTALEFIGAQSMAAIWLRFLAPPDFAARASFFLTQYSSLFPRPVVWLGVVGAVIVALQARRRLFPLLIVTSVLYVLFFEALLWLDYTTLEVRFLMYPGLPLLVFAGVALSAGRSALASLWLPRVPRRFGDAAVAAVLAVLLAMGYRQGEAGMRFIYTMHATQDQVAAELAHLVPPEQPTHVMIYAGVSGALDMFTQRRGLQLSFCYFRFVPDDQPEQFLIDKRVEYVIYPVGNAFATAKYPYLSHFESQEHAGVLFRPLAQFTTLPDRQLYSIWAIRAEHSGEEE